ncbi:MAG: T9SS type A sorting domain-containing protein [Bacteroidetes bacterium]|nr:MAG: T9SS type A sorting domain-containing protein [Bacteroidota bacterium]
MKQHFLLLLFVFSVSLNSRAQLLPSIGLSHLPSDNDSVCTIPIAQGSGSVPGISAGNLVPDFKLYTLAGDSVRLSEVLQTNIPVLLISSSYTCPVFRGKIPVINQVDSIYQGQLAVFIIYTVEAHPIIDVSPYSGNVWTTSTNQTEGVLFEQPKTYGERKSVLSSLMSNNYIRSTILIDGPCNEWWLNYGTEPNSATLIKPDGRVFAFQQWFDKAPDNIFCEIDSLLGNNSGLCTSFGNGGTFTLEGDTIDYGIPGFFIAVNATLTNQSATENVVVNIQRQGTQMPASWLTALCTDICYPPSTNSAQVTIPPGFVQAFIFYFYTDTVPANGMAQVRFINQGNSSNQYTQRFYGSTLTSGIEESVIGNQQWKIYPNPVNDNLFVDQLDQFEFANLYSAEGRLIKSDRILQHGKTKITLKEFAKGIYYFELTGREHVLRKIILN